jgi:hypothetical protein
MIRIGTDSGKKGYKHLMGKVVMDTIVFEKLIQCDLTDEMIGIL